MALKSLQFAKEFKFFIVLKIKRYWDLISCDDRGIRRRKVLYITLNGVTF